MLVVATGSRRALHYLPLELIDYFDAITLDYVADTDAEKKVVLDHLGEGSGQDTIDPALDIVSRTRVHSEVQRGVSTRGAIRYAELLSSLNNLPSNAGENALRTAARISLPHRLELSVESDTASKRDQIVEEILDEEMYEGEE